MATPPDLAPIRAQVYKDPRPESYFDALPRARPHARARLGLRGRADRDVPHRLDVLPRPRPGAEKVPSTGPVILAPNHFSFMDHFFVGAFIRRRVRFVAKSQLFKPPMQWIYSHGGVFPVRRGYQDEEAFITAEAILERGGAIVMYCEGGRSRTGEISALPRRGIGRLALESGAPVVPVAIHGSSHVRNWRRGRFRGSRSGSGTRSAGTVHRSRRATSSSPWRTRSSSGSRRSTRRWAERSLVQTRGPAHSVGPGRTRGADRPRRAHSSSVRTGAVALRRRACAPSSRGARPAGSRDRSGQEEDENDHGDDERDERDRTCGQGASRWIPARAFARPSTASTPGCPRFLPGKRPGRRPAGTAARCRRAAAGRLQPAPAAWRLPAARCGPGAVPRPHAGGPRRYACRDGRFSVSA